MFFKRQPKREKTTDDLINEAVELIKNLDRADFKRFVDGADLVNQGHVKLRNVKTREDKEVEKDIKEGLSFELTEEVKK